MNITKDLAITPKIDVTCSISIIVGVKALLVRPKLGNPYFYQFQTFIAITVLWHI